MDAACWVAMSGQRRSATSPFDVGFTLYGTPLDTASRLGRRRCLKLEQHRVERDLCRVRYPSTVFSTVTNSANGSRDFKPSNDCVRMNARDRISSSRW